jgi:CRP/FNR family transcriptional activator FtrB
MISTEMLSQNELFAGFSDERLEAIAGISKEITCNKGEALFGEGERAEYLYILVSGSIAIQVHLTSRPMNVTVAIINQPNQSFGWSGVVSPNHYTATAHCQKDSSLVAIEGSKLMQMLEQDPEIGFIVMRRISEVISSRLRTSRSAFLKTL